MAKRSWVGSVNLFIMVALLPAMALARVVAPAVAPHQAPQPAPAVGLAAPPASSAATSQAPGATPNPSVAGKRQPAGAASTPVPAGVAGPTPAPDATGPATSEPNPTPGATARPTTAPTPPATPRPTPKPTPAPTAGPPSTSVTRVVVVWMENEEASAITASSMPYLYGLSNQFGRATRMYGVSHPSEPNYLALWSGSTQGVKDDGIHNITAPTLASQVTAAGKQWRVYAQDVPGGCFAGGSASGGIDGPGVAGTYVRKHEPAISFTAIQGSASECAKIQPLAAFNPTAFNVAFVAPNLCNDMHDCSLATGDAFLAAFLPQVFNSPDWAHTLLIVTFDEGSSSTNGGGNVFTLVARQGLSGLVSSTTHNHYGVLRTIENVLGLPCLANACSATPFSEFLP